MTVAIGLTHDKNRDNGCLKFASKIGRTIGCGGHFAEEGHEDAIIAAILVGNEAQHATLLHSSGTAQDFAGATGKDFLPRATAQLVHKIAINTIGLGLFHRT